MQISNFSSQIHSSYNQRVSQLKSPVAQPVDTVAFRGHLGSETIVRNGEKLLLRNETGLFRDMQTKHFVVDYINENFANLPKINMIVGACCTGEEAFSYSMLLKHLQPKLAITGFDISSKNIAQAQSGKLVIQRPARPVHNGLNGLFSSLTDEEYLVYLEERPLSAQEIKHKQLFDDFFEVLPEIHQEKYSILEKIRFWCFTNILNMTPPMFESKIARLKPDKVHSCKFETADIFDLDKVTKGEKANVITFSNAMYHLTTEEVWGLFRQPTYDSPEVIRKIAMKVKENLNPKGIFVLGENEVGQMMDFETLPRVFEEVGFKPLNKTKEHDANVWQIIE